MTTELSRTSALASRHRELGSGLEDWNGMGTAWTYNSDPNAEHDAVREAAGLFDMSPLKKVFLRGPGAAEVVDHVITRDMTRVTPGQSAYGAILTNSGHVCDDAIIANNGGDEWMLCHGSGESMERLQESAEGKNVEIELDDSLHNISLQGPKALDLLNAHASIDLGDLKYFHHLKSELFGHPCRISRTGYSGERGYEIFADQSVVCNIWDNILGRGKSQGVLPCSFTALDKVRVEAALLFFGYDMTSEHSPWEVGLGFTVSRKKGNFRGKDAVYALEGQERFKLAGIAADHGDALADGEKLLLDGRNVGVVNSPAWSHRLSKSLALVHLHPDAIAPGTRLEVDSEELACGAVVEAIPFFDRDKTRTHA
ncbi:aminomethyltransferase family protein [Pelagibius sp. Alg239-R121]|uniref:aminomethyltransferase family protein n=1 Tax=Pelagibius sp. Alg239-R121 TaxID=2993448 RepID=UPI0024A7A45D|nr:aminomethyltransferase family protein [Pelagibius sp. Alg239-R121]